jgi:4-amino-4-deoxy-L-arabinose transferase-like glycosyltransferase
VRYAPPTPLVQLFYKDGKRLDRVLAPTVGVPTTGEKPESERTIWPYFVVAAVVVITIAAIQWSLAHPYGAAWDEAEYFNEVQIDGQRLRTLRLLRLGARMLVYSLGRPPAYRLLVLPFVWLFGFHTTELRLITFACFVLSAFFVYWAARQVSGAVAGALAALIFVLSPEVVAASLYFATDSSLYLATAAMLYFVITYWRDGAASTRNWVGLGLAVGFGALTKTSFFAIFLPVVVFWFFASRWSRLGVPGLKPQRNALLLALLIAGPWWVFNFKSAVDYGRYARSAVRSSLGPPSFLMWAHWLESFVLCLLGPSITILIVAILAASVVMLLRRKNLVRSGFDAAVIGACLCAALPTVAAQVSGTNHLMRYLTPALIPLAIIIGLLADRTGWTRSAATRSVSAVLALSQLAMLVAPSIHPNKAPIYTGFINGVLPWRATSRFDQWDWRPLVALSDECGLKTPAISYLGNARGFNPPQIQYPWVVRTTATRVSQLDIPTVKWLWRFDEDGPIDWQRVMDGANQSDMVVTAPHYAGGLEDFNNLDNQYNGAFEQRLLEDPRFQGPFHFETGRFQPIEVDVFVRKDLSCR